MEVRGGKRYRTKAERRAIVEETLKPGASVSAVARAHDINSNQVFFWRRQYREGWFNENKEQTVALVPVKITPAKTRAVTTPRQALKQGMVVGTIDIDFGHARVRVEGAADPECVRAALEGLVR